MESKRDFSQFRRTSGGAFFKEKVSKGYMVLRERKKKLLGKNNYQDNKWSRAVKKAAGGKCERCESKYRLESHHVVSRTNDLLRHVLENGVCLCYKCHVPFAHDHPEEFRLWIIEKRGQAWYDALMSLRRRGARALIDNCLEFEELKSTKGETISGSNT